MCCQPPGSRAGCQGRSSVGRSIPTGLTWTSLPRAIQFASMPEEGPLPPGEGQARQDNRRTGLVIPLSSIARCRAGMAGLVPTWSFELYPNA